MENEVRSFLVYNEWITTAEALPESDRNDLYRLIMLYGAKKEINDEEFSVVAKGIFSGMIKERIDKAQENYQHSIELGKKGGRPKILDDDDVYESLVRGETQSSIAKRYGVKPQSVNQSAGAKRFRQEMAAQF